MTVLVVAGSPDAFESVLPDVEQRRVETVAAAREAVAEEVPSALVVDGGSLEGDLQAIVDAVEAAPGTVPVVFVAEPQTRVGLRSIDSLVLRPFEEGALAEAVERALLVSDYDATVSALFEQCRTEAGAGDGPLEMPPELRALRDDADDLLDRIVALDSPDVLAALLETVEEGGVDDVGVEDAGDE